nr:hypothetical protein [Tanacetum cinerariifolium]
LTPEKDKSDDEDMYEEEDDNVAKELYGDLNITQGLKDVDMTNVEQGRADPQNASHESGFVQKEEDAHVTLTTVHDKTKDVEPSKGSKLKESKSSSSSKGTQSQPKSSGRSTQVEEPEFEAADTKMQQDQGNEFGHIDDQPDNEAALKNDCRSTQVEEPEFEAADTKMQQDQGNESGHIDDQPDNEAALKNDWSGNAYVYQMYRHSSSCRRPTTGS